MTKNISLFRVVITGVGAGVVVLVMVAITAWHLKPKPHVNPALLAYTASGYGGYRSVVAAPKPTRVVAKALAKTSLKVTPVDPVAPALSAYEKGDYAAAEDAARLVVLSAAKRPTRDTATRRAVVKARGLMAFSAARQHDLKAARDQFALMRQEASTLPGGGKPVEKPELGEEPEPTFEENAAYQHAVCTAALGDKAGAEAEYIAFMRQYPESPLLQAAIKRIARMHGGDIPKPADAVWTQAMQTDRARDLARQRDESLCGPECLAELIRSRQQHREQQDRPLPTVSALASEMNTNEHGTTLADLETAARRHGFPKAQGMALSMKGLSKQRLPLIALEMPGHYVVVESAGKSAASAGGADGAVHIWDPDANGIGHAAMRDMPGKKWDRMWRGGVALTLR